MIHHTRRRWEVPSGQLRKGGGFGQAEEQVYSKVADPEVRSPKDKAPYVWDLSRVEGIRGDRYRITGKAGQLSAAGGKPWGPYLAVLLPDVVSVDTNAPDVAVSLPNGITAAEYQLRRARAFSELAQVIAAGTHPLGSANWNGALDYHRNNLGISAAERDWLAVDQSALPRLEDAVPVSPYLLDAAKDLQARRNRALTEIPAVYARGTHALGSGEWTGAVEYHLGNSGLTIPERDRLLANRSAIFLFPSLSPYVAEIGRTLSPGDLVVLLSSIPSSTLSEDAELRTVRGWSPRAVDDATDPLYRWPRSKADLSLAPGVKLLEKPLFKYSWTVFRHSPRGMDPDQPADEGFLPMRSDGIFGSIVSQVRGALGLSVLRDHEVLIAPPCPPSGPEPRSELGWAKLPVQLFFRTQSSGTVPGPTVDHYADLSLARWWFSIALALATDPRIIARLDSVNPKNGKFPEEDATGPWNPAGWYAQMYYVRAIAEAIANGYNALNIPWYIDPLARALYRDWFAGHDEDEFDYRTNYNEGNWFTNREQCGEKRYATLRARIQPGSWDNTRVGELPARLDRLWKETHAPGDRRTLEFLQKAGVALTAGAADRDPYIATSAINLGFASGFAMGWDVFNASTLALSREPTDAERLLYQNQGKRLADTIGNPHMALDLSGSKPYTAASIFADDWYAQIIHAPPLQDRNNICDWRAAGFDPAGIGGVHVQGAVPLRWYLAWFREWALSCCVDEPVSKESPAELPSIDPARRWPGFGAGVIPRRTAGTVLRDAKTYAMDVNLAWAQILGGQGRFAAALAEKSEGFNRAQPNAAIRVVGGVVSAIGTGVTSAVVPGGVGQSAGALAGAGVTMLTELLASAFPSYDCAQYGRDDLGRAKPNFERSYLGGDPLKDVVPTTTIPIPPGFCRGNDAMPPLLPMPEAQQEEAPPDTTPPDTKTKSGLGTAGKVALVGAGLLGAAAIGVWAMNRPKAVS